MPALIERAQAMPRQGWQPTLELFPSAHALLARKLDHGRAEAALIALYGIRFSRPMAAPPGAQPGSINETPFIGSTP